MDLKAISEVAKKGKNNLLLVDNTVATSGFGETY